MGGRLLAATIEGFKHFRETTPAHLEIFTGPYLDEGTYGELANQQSESIRIRRFTEEFPALLAAADLSVSMAGYNTCMNLAVAGIPALVYPFDQNREQRMRAEKIAKIAPWHVLDQDDLDPLPLAKLMGEGMARPRNHDLAMDLNGAGNSARWLTDWVGGDAPPSQGMAQGVDAATLPGET